MSNKLPDIYHEKFTLVFQKGNRILEVDCVLDVHLAHLRRVLGCGAVKNACGYSKLGGDRVKTIGEPRIAKGNYKLADLNSANGRFITVKEVDRGE